MSGQEGQIYANYRVKFLANGKTFYELVYLLLPLQFPESSIEFPRPFKSCCSYKN